MLETRIDSVSIFRSGAEVIRKGKVELPAGKTVIEITGISSGTDRNTVRLLVSEPFVCRRFRFLSEEETDERKKESEALRKQIGLLNKENEIRAIQMNLWQANGDFTSHTSADPASVAGYINALPQRLIDLNNAVIEASGKIEQLQKELNKAVQRESGPVLSAEVEAETAGTCYVEVRYREPSAWWTPFHEIHTDGSLSLELRMRAEIHQTTGEEWNDVEVSLLSGNPNAGDELPEVNPVYLDFRPSPSPYMMAGNAMGMARMAQPMNMYMEEAAEAPVMKRAEENMAVVNEEETMSEYVLSERKTIPSDNAGIIADLLVTSIPADYRIAAAPRKDSHAYFTAEIRTSELPPRLINDAQIYLKGVYSGKTDLDPDYEKEETVLSLGREERVKVTSRQVKKKTSNVLLKGQKVTEYVYETKITNQTDKEINVRITDQIPVSRDKAIVVEPTDLSGAQLKEETGILTWGLRIGPKEAKTLSLGYKVFFPKDKTVRETN